MHVNHRLLVLLAVVLLAAGPAFTEEGKFETTASGLQHALLEAGRDEPPPSVGDRVTFHYVSSLADGTEIGNSRKRDQPLSVDVNEKWLVPGLLEGIQLLRPGGRATFRIPWKLGYGEAGKRARGSDKDWVVPPKTDLVYDIELIEIVRRPVFKQDIPEGEYKVLAPGLRMKVLREGAGPAARAQQRVRWRFALWNQDHVLVQSTFHDQKYVDGHADKLRLSDKGEGERFFKAALPHMKKGGRYWFEVAPGQGYGNEKDAHRLIPAGTQTWWELEVVDIGAIPAFEKPVVANQKTTATGLKYEVLREGSGPKVRWGRWTEMHYVGWLKSGFQFDTSFRLGRPWRSKLTSVIDGWKEGLPMMRQGSVYRFEIPPALGYGARASGKIPANSTLVFWVEVTKVW